MAEREGFFWPQRSNKAFSMGAGKHALTCSDCGLHRNVRSPKMKVTGKGKKKILFIAEAPGEEEDFRGVQLVGRVGEYFRDILDDMGYDLDRDFFKINAINCRPTNKSGANRPPSGREVKACRPRVWKTITDVKPKVIIPMGQAAIDCLYGHRWKRRMGKISQWIGWTIPDYDVNAWVCPTYHPSFAMRHEQRQGNAAEVLIRKHLKKAIAKRKKPLPERVDLRDMVKCLTSKKAVTKLLQNILRNPPEWLVTDFETTGLKPHKQGHRILCVSVCWRRDKAYVFPMSCANKKLLRKVFRHRRIKKVAQKINFEESWARTILGYRIRPWGWDTMICNHVQDNRSGITSIKFQGCVRYGVMDYASHMRKWLETPKKLGANAMNDIENAPLDQLLVYCGCDSLLEFWLLEDQLREMGVEQ